MRFAVRHETTYHYNAPVRLGTHRLRLTPRDDAGQLILRRLEIFPEPVLCKDESDSHGNRLTLVGFGEPTADLRIDSRFELVTAVRGAPLAAALPGLPWRWPDTDPAAWDALRPCLEGPDPGEAVRGFARDMAEMQGGGPLGMLDALTTALYRRTDRRIRDTGYAQSPEETLRLARGACRDLAVLFIAICRVQGIPARFVSGYQARAESVDGKRHLHAWPEAWLPGHGWQGFDPTHGTRVTDGHVALCAAPDQAATMPVEGGYFGDATGSTLRYSVEIQAEG